MIARKRWPALKKEETRKLWRVWKRSRWEFRIVISSSFIASSVLQTVCLCLLLFSFFFLCDYFGFYHSVEMQCNRGEYAAFPMTSPKDQMSKSYRLRTTTTIIGLGVVRKILATFIPYILNHLHPTPPPRIYPNHDWHQPFLTDLYAEQILWDDSWQFDKDPAAEDCCSRHNWGSCQGCDWEDDQIRVWWRDGLWVAQSAEAVLGQGLLETIWHRLFHF